MFESVLLSLQSQFDLNAAKVRKKVETSTESDIKTKTKTKQHIKYGCSHSYISHTSLVSFCPLLRSPSMLCLSSSGSLKFYIFLLI